MSSDEPRQSGQRPTIGGVVHTYQKYDPAKFPSPTREPPDLVSPIFEQLLFQGEARELTEEELARAIRLDPSQIAGLGPSLDMLRRLLEERKRKILETYETDGVVREASRKYQQQGRRLEPPGALRKPFRQAFDEEQIYDLERLWYRAERDSPQFAAGLLPLMETLGDKYQIDELVAKYRFTGRAGMNVPQALEIKAELEKIDELLRQLEEAERTAQIALIDMDALAEFVDQADLNELENLRRQLEEYVREQAARQGLERGGDGRYQLTPQAVRIFQGKLLQEIFSQLAPSRTGRHSGSIIGDGAVEMPQTRPYEFGDPVSHLDIPASFTNALLRSGPGLPVKLAVDDLVVHQTRNHPKCATVVVMDMSGSMRHDGQYVNVKRMALALEGLLRKEYPGDFLRFIEMATFARPVPASELVSMMYKSPTIFDPIVRLRADMSDPAISDWQIPPHFTNIQHGLSQARKFLAAQDTPNRQVILITDGLPTAHFEESTLYMLYPPDPRTEEATLREGQLCRREGITINVFLLPGWSQTSEDIQFAQKLARSTTGRVFFTAGRNLDRFVLWDYVERKRRVIG